MVQPIDLIEYVPKELPRSGLSPEVGEFIWREFGNRITVEFPSPATQGKWRLTSQGWVGHIPMGRDLQISIAPKVPLGNVFRMLEYAYRLGSFELLDSVFEASSMQEFYDQVAVILAKRILARGRKGFYRSYVDMVEPSRFVRGGIEMASVVRKPWRLSPICRFQEHTPDLLENQLLGWTLFLVARSGLCTDRSSPLVRRAFRLLNNAVSLQPFTAQDCVGILYTRLDDDYEPLHALCRFFLSNSGPTHAIGEHAMLPFLVNMANLFQLFVYEWLQSHLPPGFRLVDQERVEITPGGTLAWKADLTLRSYDSDIPMMILDTKYKDADEPSGEDIMQVVAYAEAKDCREAVLVYPRALKMPLDAVVGRIRVRSAEFQLGGELETAGEALLQQLGIVGRAPSPTRQQASS